VNIILFGPPGAGKGTQAEFISKNFNLYKISTGDLLRNEIRMNTQVGVKVRSIVNAGSLVSDEIINDLMSKIFLDKKYFNRLIFDGYPRNITQAKGLDVLIKKYKQKISCVLSLVVDKETIIKRVLGRQICSNCGVIFNEYFKPSSKNNHSCDPKFLTKRSDDNEKTISSRFETYLKKTLPILEFYKNQNLLREIDGVSKISLIYKEIEVIMSSLET